MISNFPIQDCRRIFASRIAMRTARRKFLIAFNLAVVIASKNHHREEGGVNSLQKTKRGN